MYFLISDHSNCISNILWYPSKTRLRILKSITGNGWSIQTWPIMGTMQSMHEKNDQIWNFKIWFNQLWPYFLRKLPEKCNPTQMFCLSIGQSKSHCFRPAEPETWIKNPISCNCTYVSNYACCNQISRSSWFGQQSKIQKRPGWIWTSIQVII